MTKLEASKNEIKNMLNKSSYFQGVGIQREKDGAEGILVYVKSDISSEDIKSIPEVSSLGVPVYIRRMSTPRIHKAGSLNL